MNVHIQTLVRTYARTIFRLAKEKELSAWTIFLNTVSAIAQDQAMQDIIRAPLFEPEKILSCFLDVLDPSITTEQKNFLLFLTKYRRLILLPEIAAQFETYCQAEKNVSIAKIISARPLTDAQEKTLSAALSKRFSNDFILNVTVDQTLLSGVTVQVNDWLLDASLRGQLHRLKTHLVGVL